MQGDFSILSGTEYRALLLVYLHIAIRLQLLFIMWTCVLIQVQEPRSWLALTQYNKLAQTTHNCTMAVTYLDDCSAVSEVGYNYVTVLEFWFL